MNSIPNTSEARPGANAPEFSVSELSGAIKRALEDGFGYVRLKGEISGYRGPHASGHCYFALKDDKAKIEAVIWKGSFGRLRFKPEEGMEVIAQGKITTFPGSSKYQIVIEALEPAGAGALMALLEERKRKFAAEGLFDEARKKPRPFLPKVVGIVTSPTGAVIRDMLHGFNERYPARVLLWPVRVQGDGSAAEVAAAIRGFNALEEGGKIPRPDVLIVARGGGSLEDLWSFNEEIVVRAAAESRIPLISAVGHETDWTLIDLVADARAPTPTKAAEWAVPKYSELIDGLEKLMLRKRTAVRRSLEGAKTHLKASSRGLPKLQDLVALPRQRFDEADRRLSRALLANTRAHATRLARVSGRLSPSPILQKHSRCAERLQTLERRAGRALLNRVAVSRRVLDGKAALLNSLGYHSILSRGFALVRNEAGQTIRQAASVVAGSMLNIELSDGQIAARAEGPLKSDRPKADQGVGKTPRQKPGGRGGQGSLF
ncbi:exodeoxyribonuclease VII large subunit [Hyphomicrobium facile]|uniref:Exodeoxyribonuclease 7 large subunit n=1 Tax=Hyphomicrobium facile TaxID=51670 RepID=A0A1I7NLL0_9HYPH|nr:exodeoxyribonuclease VII large subunit [Hyphomicrobium facile]SFV35526.1 Exodeoxyribonuclease VII large subunit [Hyphomicrobium facile]